jgi:uncharacterized protein (TIGR02231 family)
VTVSIREIPVEKEYIAIPRESQYVFLKAKLKNTTPSLLLSGPLSIFFDGSFVNMSLLPLFRQGEILDLAMGIDEGVKIERVPYEDESMKKGLFKKKTELPSGYTIKVKNLKQSVFNVTVMDLVPVSKSKEVKVDAQVINPKPDAMDVETGILTWKLSLKPGEAKEIKVKYVITHPENNTLSEYSGE